MTECRLKSDLRAGKHGYKVQTGGPSLRLMGELIR